MRLNMGARVHYLDAGGLEATGKVVGFGMDLVDGRARPYYIVSPDEPGSRSVALDRDGVRPWSPI